LRSTEIAPRRAKRRSSGMAAIVSVVRSRRF
jgi:hypothetical protein